MSFLRAKLPLLLIGTTAIGLTVALPFAWHQLSSPGKVQAQELTAQTASLTSSLDRIFTVNIPSAFKELVTIAALTVEGDTIFGGPVTFSGGSVFDGQITLQGDVLANGISIDLGSGQLTASNVLYSLVEGDGITISEGQTPTITNSDRGSAQSIFKKIKLGSDTTSADGNDDTLEFAAGSGISLSLDTDNDKLTITNSATPGLVKSSTYAIFADGVTRLGVGTSTPGNTVEINSGTSGASGLAFTNLTSASSVGAGGGKVLSVDSGGNVILVTDESGSAAEGDLDTALPGGSTGSTIYFDGSSWAHSTNLYHNGGQVGISTIPGTNIRFDVKTNATTSVGMVIRRVTSQTANLMEFRNESDSILSYVDKDGVFNGSIAGSGSFNPGFTTGSVAFQGASGLTQDNTNFFWDDTNNRLGLGTTSPASLLHIAGTTNTGGIAFGDGTQRIYSDNSKLYFRHGSNDRGYWNNGIWFVTQYGGADLPSYSFDGDTNSGLSGSGTDVISLMTGGSHRLTVNASGYVGIGTASPHSLLTIAGNLSSTTATVSANYAGGNALTVIGGPSANTTHIAQVKNNSGTTMFAVDGYGRTSIKASGTVNTDFMVGGTTGNDNLSDTLVYFLTRDASQKGLVVRGTTSQSANLTEWQNSSGSTLARFNQSGQLFAPYGEFVTTSSSLPALVVRGVSNQTANIFRVQKSDSTDQLIVDANGNVSIGASTGTSKLHVEASTGAALARLNQTGSGDILTASASGTTRLVVTNAGDVGIGTTSPGFQQHILGDGQSTANIANSGSSGGTLLLQDSGVNAGDGGALLFGANPTSTTSFFAGIKGLLSGGVNNTIGHLAFSTRNAQTDATLTERMRITSSGAIGIGTTSPDTVPLVNISRNSDDNYDLLISDGGTGDPNLAFNISGTSYSIGIDNSDSDKFKISASTALGTSNRLTIDSTGNVGLGTSTPGYKLEVTGTSYFSAQARFNSALFMHSNTSTTFFGSSSQEALAYRNNSATDGAWTSLSFQDASANEVAAIGMKATDQTNHYGALAFGTKGTDGKTTRMYINPEGLVGIGTTNPGTSRLYVLQSANNYFGTNVSGEGFLTAVSDNSTAPVLYVKGTGTADLVNIFDNTTEVFTILDGGNVGIGTASPDAPLTVTTTGSTQTYNTFIGGRSAQESGAALKLAPSIQVSSAAKTNMYGMHIAPTFTDNVVGTDVTNFSSIYAAPITGGVAGAITNTYGLYIGENTLGTNNYGAYIAGSVGIGNSTPLKTLHVGAGADASNLSTNGLYVTNAGNTALIVRNSTSNVEGFMYAGSGTTADELIFGSATAHPLRFRTTNATRMTLDTSGNLGLGATTFGTSAASVLAIAGSTAPATAITDGIQLFAVDVAGSHELQVMDEAANITTLSPHNFSVIGNTSEEMAWSFYSERNSLAINADMTKALRLVEKLSGEKLVYLKDLESGFLLEDESDATHITQLADNGSIGEVAKWNYELWTFVGQVIFEKPVTFLASIRANGPVWLGGRVTFADKDMAGYAVIPAEGKEVRITFSTPFEHKPVVSVTTENSVATHTITDVSSSGFTITLNTLAAAETTFHWIALRAENVQTTTGTKATAPSPTPSPVTSPSPTVSPSPTPETTPAASSSAQTASADSTQSGTLSN